MTSIVQKQKGFSLIELMIAISIFSMLIFIVIAVFETVLFGSNQQFLALDNVDNARLVMSRFVNEIRNASVGVDGSYQLNTAGDNQIIFYSKSSYTGLVNRINYYLSGTTLYRGITAPSGNPQTYNLAQESKTLIQKDVVNQASPIFTYYDGNYDGNTRPLSQPVNVTLVKFIKINLTVLNQVQSHSQSNFSISAGANIRNLKTNLGN